MGGIKRIEDPMPRQIIEVSGSRLRFVENGHVVFESRCGHGRCGFTSDKREGDGKTPVGTFEIESVFGFEKPEKCLLPFRRIGPNSWWSGERENYNEWVELEMPDRVGHDGKIKAGIEGEKLADYPVEYKLAFVLGYNRKQPEWGRGSAIFLHCKGAKKWNTAGCISLPERRIRTLVESLEPGAVIKIASPSK